MRTLATRARTQSISPALLRRWQQKLEWAVTLDSFGVAAPHQVQARYRRLLAATEYVVELPDYVLVHASLNFADPNRLWTDHAAMLNRREYGDVSPALLGGRPLLHGHVPQPLHQTRRALQAAAPPHIGLDTGCVYYKNAAYGSLVALDLDTRCLHVQPNADRPYAGGRK